MAKDKPKLFVNPEINPNGFIIIEATSYDFMDRCGFGIGSIICDCCAEEQSDDELVYYVCVLNDVLCWECLKKWLSDNPTRYKEDISYEQRKYNEYAEELNLPILN